VPAWRRLAASALGAVLVLVWARQVVFNDLPRVLEFLEKMRRA
jgi:hypothetical protein